MRLERIFPWNRAIISKTLLSLVNPFEITGSRRLQIQLTGEANVSVGLSIFNIEGGEKRKRGRRDGIAIYVYGWFSLWWPVSLVWIFLYLPWRYPLAVPHFLARQLGSQGGDFPHTAHISNSSFFSHSQCRLLPVIIVCFCWVGFYFIFLPPWCCE